MPDPGSLGDTAAARRDPAAAPAAEVTAAGTRGAWSALRQPLFRALWVANVVSGIGGTMHDTAAVWTMTLLTPSATLVSLMQAMSSLPLFLLALPAGALADIVDRRRVLLWAQGAGLVVAAALAAVSGGGGLSPAVLLAATFALGVSAAFTAPTWQALMAETVSRPDRPGAITLGSVGVNIARAVGPLLGGGLVAMAGPSVVFLANAVSFVGILVVLWRAPVRGAETDPHRERMLGAMVAAGRFTRHSPPVRAVLVRSAAFGFCGIAPMALLPVLVRHRGLGAADFGVWMGAYGAGGIVAAFTLLPALRGRWSNHRILLGATAVFAAGTAGLALVPERWGAAAILGVAGAAWLVALSTFAVVGQSAFPDWVRARSSAIALLVLQGALAAGALAWGSLASRTGVVPALLVAAGGLAASWWLGLRVPVGREQGADASASRHWADHDVAFTPADDDGPVRVTLAYEVAEADERAFRAAMNELRRVRLRDGAFRWALWQSLEQPARFEETFLVGSWGEHLRQHLRATAGDAAVEAAAQRFHRGASAPVARHARLRDTRRAGDASGETS